MAVINPMRFRALAAGLFLLASCVANAQSFELLLKKADSLRTANTKQFNVLLARLDQIDNQATPGERMQLRLLHAYQPLLAGDYQSSISQLKALLASQPDIDIRFRAGAMLANNYALAHQFSDGLEILRQTLMLGGRVTDPNVRQQGLLVAAVLYNQVGQYPLGLHYSEEVLSNPLTSRNKCIADGVQIEALLNLSQPLQDAYISDAIRQCQSLNEGIPAGLLAGFLGRKWYGEGKLEEATALLEDTLPSIEATHFPRGIGEIRSLLAEVLLRKGDLAGAERNANAAVSQKAGIAGTPPLSAAYKVLYQIAERRNELPTALDYYKKYAEADKGYLNEVKTRELAYQIVRNESLQSSQQIKLLDRENRVLQLQQKVDQASAQNSHQLLLLATLLALTLGLWAYKTKRLQMSVKRLAETDSLTGICNRHHFTSQAEHSLSRCLKSGEHASLIMFDLDYFKAINDNYGHVTGDWVLKRVARTCGELCRGIDHFGRIGGEEFAILLLGCDLKAAARVAEDARMRLSIIDATESGFQFTVTASFGVSATSMSGHDLDKLLSHADLMLYRAKREGRNRVRAYVPDTSVELGGPVLRAGEAELREIHAGAATTPVSTRA